MPERAVLSFVAAFALLLASAAAVGAQDYPAKPVVIITSTAAGGGPDVIARTVADRLTELWQQRVFVENRPGSLGAIATLALTHARPDGNTLCVTLGSTYIVLPEVQKNLPFDVERDLIPIGLVGEQPFVIAVDPKLGIGTLAGLIDYARKHLGEVFYGTIRGSMPHLVMELLQSHAGTGMALVPYPATVKAVNDVIGGRIAVVIDSLSSLGGFVQSGQLKALAVTSAKRLPEFPDLPAVAETFPGIEGTGWFALTAPAGTPDVILRKVNRDLRTALENDNMKIKFAKLGTYSHPMSLDEIARFIHRQREVWSPVVEKIGLMAH
jgi:tripartite-type tricarboxylate transporter receptor subunit TctC